jgi:hypothetical protein
MTRDSKLFAILLSAAATFGVEAAAVAEAPAEDGGDSAEITFSRPAEKQPGCFADSMRLPRELLDRLPQKVDVQFTISEDGSVQGVTAEGATPALATQIRGALSRCAWIAAADERGVPMAVAVKLPVRFDLGASARGESQQAVASVEAPSYAPIALDGR